MMRYALLALLLAGCSSPGDVRKSQHTETMERPGALSTVAMCVTRGFDEIIRTPNNLRLDEAGGTAELIGRAQDILFGGDVGVAYVVDFRRLPNKAVAVTYYIASDALFPGTQREKIRKIIQACPSAS